MGIGGSQMCHEFANKLGRVLEFVGAWRIWKWKALPMTMKYTFLLALIMTVMTVNNFSAAQTNIPEPAKNFQKEMNNEIRSLEKKKKDKSGTPDYEKLNSVIIADTEIEACSAWCQTVYARVTARCSALVWPDLMQRCINSIKERRRACVRGCED
jgi:hypothetical protein